MKKVWVILAFMIAANIVLVAYTAQRRIKFGESILKDGYALFSENESINLSYFAETVAGKPNTVLSATAYRGRLCKSEAGRKIVLYQQEWRKAINPNYPLSEGNQKDQLSVCLLHCGVA